VSQVTRIGDDPYLVGLGIRRVDAETVVDVLAPGVTQLQMAVVGTQGFVADGENVLSVVGDTTSIVRPFGGRARMVAAGEVVFLLDAVDTLIGTRPDGTTRLLDEFALNGVKAIASNTVGPWMASDVGDGDLSVWVSP
jgi:hypothetical protein